MPACSLEQGITNAMIGGLAAGMAPDFAQVRYESVLWQRLQSFYETQRPIAKTRHNASNGGQFAHDPVEAGLTLEADAGAARERNRAILDSGVIGKTTEVAKDTRIGFGAAKAETGGDGE